MSKLYQDQADCRISGVEEKQQPLLDLLLKCSSLRLLPVVLLQMAIDCAYDKKTQVLFKTKELTFNWTKPGAVASIEDTLLYCPQLKSLTLASPFTRLSEYDMLCIAKCCKSLRSIDVSVYAHCTECLCRLFQHLPLLEHVTINNSQATDLAVETLAKHCASLKLFAAPGSRIGDRAVFALLLQCPGLEILSISDTQVSEDAFRAVGTYCPLLRVLEANYTRVTDKSLFVIAKHCSRLEKLSVAQTRHMGANIGMSSITKIAQNCPRVTYIELTGTKIDEEQLVHLKSQWPRIEFKRSTVY